MSIPTQWRLAICGLVVAAALPAQEAEPAAPAEEPQEQVEEVIVVTASRTEQPLNEAPAAITVLTARTIESIPADDYGDLLRNVPGLNVSQTSARDINMTARGATNTLVDLAARAARRPLDLPRLLRLRDVGLPAGQHRARSSRSRWCAARAARSGAPTP